MKHEHLSPTQHSNNEKMEIPGHKEHIMVKVNSPMSYISLSSATWLLAN